MSATFPCQDLQISHLCILLLRGVYSKDDTFYSHSACDSCFRFSRIFAGEGAVQRYSVCGPKPVLAHRCSLLAVYHKIRAEIWDRY